MAKAKTFRLGSVSPSGTSCRLPNDLAVRRSAVFGISGSGKSNTATVCIEGLIRNGEQVVLIDPKGEGWGLKSSADGKSAGLDVIIFGEPHGDIKTLDETHGEKLADFVVESGRSVVLSLQGFESDESERRFVTRFFKRLYRIKSRQAAPTRTLVILDEAHLFVPESSGQGHKGDTAQMVGAIQRIARQGRSAGLGLMIVDQRPQDVSKRIISQVELLVCHQLVHKLDRNALRDWVRGYDRDGTGDVFLDSLAGLQQGEAWSWSPGWLQVFDRVLIERRSTYDSGATPSGKAAAAPKVRSKVDLDQLRDQLAEVVQKAEQQDPGKLQKRIAELERQLKRAESAKAPAGIDKAEADRLAKAAIADRDEQWSREVVNWVSDRLIEIGDTVTKSVKSSVQGVSLAAEGVRRRNGSIPGGKPKTAARADPGCTEPRGKRRPAPAATAPGDTATRETLSPIAVKTLDAFAWWHVIGVGSVTRQQVAMKAGYTNAETSSFRKALYELRDGGLVDDKIRKLTDLGHVAASAPNDPGDIETYHAIVCDLLSGVDRDAFKALAKLTDRVGDSTTRQQHAGELGYTNAETSSYRKALYRMRTMGLVTLGRGQIVVTPLFWPESLK